MITANAFIEKLKEKEKNIVIGKIDSCRRMQIRLYGKLFVIIGQCEYGVSVRRVDENVNDFITFRIKTKEEMDKEISVLESQMKQISNFQKKEDIDKKIKKNEIDYIYNFELHRIISGKDVIITVKTGHTNDVVRTYNTYKRTHSDIDLKLLGVWKSNSDLTIDECEEGILQLSDNYNKHREREISTFDNEEKFKKFLDHIDLLLKKETTIIVGKK